eukprot:TRINITY_DN23552_c0_g1_i1.p1 TRINITY_DN23552_c0_g1~~TRINITY_DN23552_c0_g1_i1.p1  ORF type:complete len:285 (+),score=56.11 TRINITY_DN23552_c0_g1_i1:64-918(+)
MRRLFRSALWCRSRRTVLTDSGLLQCTETEVPGGGKVLHVVFNNEERLNALSESAADDIISLGKRLQEEHPAGIRCVVFTGKGRAFCTGRDLKATASHTPDQARQYMIKCIESAAAIEQLPMPTIAAINGHCFGWGLEAALACDIRIAAQGAILCFPETRLGMFPGAGGTVRAARMLNPSVARQLIYTARTFSGKEALKFGVVSKAVERESLDSEVAELAMTIAGNSPLGLRGAKRVMNHAMDADLETAMHFSRAERMKIAGTRDFAEGIRAMAARRHPKFEGC